MKVNWTALGSALVVGGRIVTTKVAAVVPSVCQFYWPKKIQTRSSLVTELDSTRR